MPCTLSRIRSGGVNRLAFPVRRFKTCTFAAIVLFSLVSSAQSPYVQGTVREPLGGNTFRFVQGAKITTIGRYELHEVITDQDGYFQLTLKTQPPQSVQLVVSREDYRPTIKRISTTQDIDNPVDLIREKGTAIQRSPPSAALPPVIKGLVQQLHSTDESQRVDALAGLSEWGDKGVGATPDILVALADSRPRMQAAAANALRAIGVSSEKTN